MTGKAHPRKQPVTLCKAGDGEYVTMKVTTLCPLKGLCRLTQD